MSTSKKPVTKTDVARSLAAIETNIKQLVRLLGDPDDGVIGSPDRVVHRNALDQGRVRAPSSIRISLSILDTNS